MKYHIKYSWCYFLFIMILASIYIVIQPTVVKGINDKYQNVKVVSLFFLKKGRPKCYKNIYFKWPVFFNRYS